jgi:hypothetical protein
MMFYYGGGKGPLGRPRNRWEFNIKVFFFVNNGRGLDSFGLGTGPVTGCCETG